MRCIVIGDIHGCYDELQRLLDAIGPTEEDLILSVGDIVDRGPDSVKVFEFFEGRKNAKVLMGNHERKHARGIFSYGQEIVRLQFGEQYNRFVKWTQKLDYYYENEDAIVVHAAFENGVPLVDQRPDVLCGSTSGSRYLETQYTEGYWSDYYTGSKPIIFGHHVVGDQPKIIDNKIWGIDTGACHGGKLTAISLPDFKIHQTQAPKDYWLIERKRWQLPILKAKKWLNWDFERIERETKRFRGHKNVEVSDFITELDAWVEELKKISEKAVLELQKQTNDLLQNYGNDGFTEQARQKSLSPLLFICRSGKLTAEMLLQKFGSPARLLELANQLDLKTPTQPF